METPTSKTQNQLIKKTDLLEKTVYRSLSDAQATILLTDGEYEDINVPDGEIFACEDGSFKKYADEIDTSGSLTQTINQLSVGYFLAFKEPDEDYPNGIVLQGDYGTVKYSYDRGVTWSNAVSVTGGYSYCFVVRDTETQVQKFVVVIETGDSFTIIKSVDGSTWSSPITASRDGNWSKDSPDTKFNPTNYVVDNKMFMFFSNSANRFYIYSEDEGATWVRVDLPAMVGTGGSEDRNPVVLCNGTLVMFQALGKYALFTSTNGLTWINTGVNFNSVNYYGDYHGAGNFASIWDGSSLYVFDIRTITSSYVGAFSFAPQLLYAYGEMSYLLLSYQNGEVYSADEATAFDFSNPKFTGLYLDVTSYGGNGTEVNGDTFVIKNAPDAWTPARSNTALIDVAIKHDRSLNVLSSTKLSDIATAGNGIKFETTSKDFAEVGTVPISAGIAGPMDSSNYIYSNEISIDTTKSWEIRTELKWNSLSRNAILAIYKNSLETGNIGMRISCDNEQGGKLRCAFSSDGGWSWIGGGSVDGLTVLSANQDYWIKVGWDGSKYYAYLSTDGVDYGSPEIELTSSTPINSTSGNNTFNRVSLGNDGAYGYFTGTLSLDDTALENDGAVIWQPYMSLKKAIISLDVATDQANAPQQSDEGYVGKLYVTTGGDVYICTGVSGSTYTWQTVGKSNVNKYTANNTALTSVSGICSWTVTHNLGTKDVNVSVYDLTTGTEPVYNVTHSTINTVVIELQTSTNISADSYRVVILG